MMDSVEVLVIGGGPAGVTAALRARELGASVALVERDRMGGTCTNDGCVPTRVLAKAARLRRDAEQGAEYGLLGELPRLDFARLLNRTQRMVYGIQEKKQLISHLEGSGVQVHAGVGDSRFIDANTLELSDGQTLQAEKFVLCLGGHPRRPTLPGAELGLTHSDTWSLKQLPRSFIVVGGAATGCQVASNFAAFGSEVTILERAPHLLAMEDEAVSEEMREAFERRGIAVMTGIEAVERVEKNAHGLNLLYRSDGRETSLQAEAVLFAIGWVGNVDGLNLEAAGVRVEAGYVPVNEHLQTSAPHIFAAGDITGRMMLVQSAGYEARIAAENAVLGPELRFEHRIVPHGGFTDPEYGSVGLTERTARENGEQIAVAEVSYAELDRAVIDGRPEGLLKLIVSQETHRILGAHAVGEQALEIVQIVSAGMAADMWVEQLAEMELAYPTFTAIVGLAARKVVHQLGVVPLAPEWRALGRPHGAEWERRDGS
ncbi:MAG TPA: NAD(P)/FAD-dependent oxidoreductase [Anaerolineales bacterium]|nr:NAD(P)/FAD-dependent oxidoreductase [Anaerolineales bacterium]